MLYPSFSKHPLVDLIYPPSELFMVLALVLIYTVENLIRPTHTERLIHVIAGLYTGSIVRLHDLPFFLPHCDGWIHLF